ncbi:phospholipase D-like domain-containing protein [Hymenobacter sp. GOD-10R]|uniref:phospholipase D-like domain-containing protein n=1 Tax=Hymenobacter sp. GOD-10R TaxID=3093922 RepID=UPI002D77FEF4|nr:phospholipase D-like domain-containing protein [Hymenobacter sp. GOD-10R]WRQ28887.1 phospholipase D-like domain-containing protein [Hymenobacter sp. GOD-10R]
MSPSAATTELLARFRRAFADSTLSAEEARDLRERLAAHGLQGNELEALRHQLFAMAEERFNTFKDKKTVEWLEAASALLLSPSTPQLAHAEVFFSPGTECLDAILGFINRAAHRLDVCVFTISDDRIAEALLAAHRKGTTIRLLTDNDKLHDQGSDIKALQAAGLAVRIDNTPNHMHHKFALADERLALTGSYNWTRSAALANLENLLITDNTTVVQRYATEFNRLWQEMQVYEGH